MVRKTSGKVGSGITRRGETLNESECPEEAGELFHTFMRRTPNWSEENRHIIEWCRAKQERLRPEMPEGGWKKYDDLGWYVNHILINNSQVTAMIALRNATGAALAASRMGDLVAEMRMKFTWEEAALTGAKVREGASHGAEMRSSSPATRQRQQQFFREYDSARERGVGITIARQRAAQSVGYNSDYARRLLKRR